MDRLASLLQKRAESSSKAAASGLIINTLGWVEGIGYDLQMHAISALKASIVIVMEQDRLYNQVCDVSIRLKHANNWLIKSASRSHTEAD